MNVSNEDAVDADGKRLVVAVVEDDQHVRDLMIDTLVENGYDVQAASDGQQGIDVILNRKPALVLLDLMLPKIDGLQILRRMSENAEASVIPVVIVSAYAAAESTRRQLRAQPNVRHVFTKPISTRELLAKMKEILNAG